MITNSAYGATTQCSVANCLETDVPYVYVPDTGVMSATCKSHTKQRLGTQCVQYCESCNTGSVLTDATYSLSVCGNTLPVKYCKVTGSSGTTCSATAYSSLACGSTPENILASCASPTKQCFGGKYVQTCATCAEGTNPVMKSVEISGCSNVYSYTDCIMKPAVSGCTTDEDCAELNEDWVNVPERNYQVKKMGKCVTSGLLKSCKAENEFRCKTSFYGSGQNCTACPPVGGDYTLLSGTVTCSAGTTVITGCRINLGATIKDTTGIFQPMLACRYQQ